MKVLLVFGSNAARAHWLRFGKHAPSVTVHETRSAVSVGESAIVAVVVESVSDAHALQRGLYYDLVLEDPSFDARLRDNRALAVEWEGGLPSRLPAEAGTTLRCACPASRSTTSCRRSISSSWAGMTCRCGSR